MENRIGIYGIVRVLGDGGMGTVYEGRDPRFDRPVAIKVLHPQFQRDPGVVERFKSEAIIQAKLNHPNIVTVFDFVANDSTLAMVMEFVDGKPLDVLLREHGAMLPERATALMTQLLSAMAYAHAQGLVHRDIKPSNIIVQSIGGEEIAKVLDFGIAKILGSEKMRTATGAKMGTLAYMSPEHVRSPKHVDARSDIYSLGATLYEMLTGAAPFDGDSEYELMEKIIQEPPRSFDGRPMPAQLRSAVEKSIAKDPNERWPSAEAFRSAIRSATPASPGPSATTAPHVARRLPPPPPPAPSGLEPLSDSTFFEQPLPGPIARFAPRLITAFGITAMIVLGFFSAKLQEPLGFYTLALGGVALAVLILLLRSLPDLRALLLRLEGVTDTPERRSLLLRAPAVRFLADYLRLKSLALAITGAAMFAVVVRVRTLGEVGREAHEQALGTPGPWVLFIFGTAAWILWRIGRQLVPAFQRGGLGRATSREWALLGLAALIVLWIPFHVLSSEGNTRSRDYGSQQGRDDREAAEERYFVASVLTVSFWTGSGILAARALRRKGFATRPELPLEIGTVALAVGVLYFRWRLLLLFPTAFEIAAGRAFEFRSAILTSSILDRTIPSWWLLVVADLVLFAGLGLITWLIADILKLAPRIERNLRSRADLPDLPAPNLGIPDLVAKGAVGLVALLTLMKVGGAVSRRYAGDQDSPDLEALLSAQIADLLANRSTAGFTFLVANVLFFLAIASAIRLTFELARNTATPASGPSLSFASLRRWENLGLVFGAVGAGWAGALFLEPVEFALRRADLHKWAEATSWLVAALVAAATFLLVSLFGSLVSNALRVEANTRPSGATAVTSNPAYPGLSLLCRLGPIPSIVFAVFFGIACVVATVKGGPKTFFYWAPPAFVGFVLLAAVPDLVRVFFSIERNLVARASGPRVG